MLTLTEIESLAKPNKYKLRCKIEFSEDEIYEVRYEDVVGMSVEHNYETNLFPILKLQINISNKVYYKIIERKDDVLFNLNFSVFNFQQNIDVDDYQPVIENRIFQGRFKPMLDNVTPFKYINNNKEDIEDSNGYGSNELNTETYRMMPMTFYLFNVNNLRINNKLFNFIIDDDNILAALGYLVNQSEIENLIISRPENDKFYKQIILPPLNFKQSINFLQKNYGIYRTGIKTYLDFNRNYIVNNNLELAPKSIDEPKKIIIILSKINDTYANATDKFFNYEEKKIQYIFTSDKTEVNNKKDIFKKIVGN